MKKQIFSIMRAPLSLEDSSPAWLRPRFFQRFFSNISFSLVPCSIIFAGVKWLPLSLGSAILESCVFGIYIWLMEDTFSFRKLRNAISAKEEANILAKRHIQLTIVIMGCFIFIWLCALAVASR